MSPFFVEAWTSGIVGAAMKALNVTAVFAGASASADFTGDGVADILLAMCEDVRPYGAEREGSTLGRLLLLRGNGDGTFVSAPSLLTSAGRFDGCIRKSRTGDFNGDGIADFVSASSSEDGRTISDALDVAEPQTAYLSGAGKLARTALGLKTWGHALAVGDWNNDGLEDIAIGGFTPHPGQVTGSAVFLQKQDGTLERHFVDGMSGLSVAIADVDGDGAPELVDYWTDWSVEEQPSGMRFTAIESDGSLGASQFEPEEYLRREWGITWNGDPAEFWIRLDADGNEYIDSGIHDVKEADIDGDGRDDIVAVRFGSAMNYVEGVLHDNGEGRTFLELYTLTNQKLKPMNTKISGWKSPKYGLFDYRLIDWNGDGHIDIFVPAPEQGRQFTQIFLNDGQGNFSRLKQSFLPSVNSMALVGAPVDANGDGIFDILLHLNGLDTEWMPDPPPASHLFLGTKRFYTGPGFANPALRGAPGFNEDYYLNAHPQVAGLVKQGKFKDGLEHYLKFGRKKGWEAFARSTIVYGSDRADRIRLREGNEVAIGGRGQDTYFGGPGADTFRFEEEEDSGATPSTRDVILDFLPGTDRIDLSAMDANGKKPGRKKFMFLTKRGSKFNRVAGELRWLWQDRPGKANDITLLEGDTDADGKADFQVELKGLKQIRESDLQL